GLEQRLECPDVLKARIEPEAPRLLRQDHRHPFVDRPHLTIGRRRDDGKRANLLSRARIAPGGPETSKRKWLAVEPDDGVRDFAGAFLFPFVEAVDRDQAALPPERRA